MEGRTQTPDYGKESQRAEVLSTAVAANMRRRKDLPIALAMQPVAACAWAVVDGLASESDLHGEALAALEKIELRSKAIAERNLLAKVAEDTWECMQEETEPRTRAEILEDLLNECGIDLPEGVA
ncbi:MAG: hypothetical protein WCK40_08175 [Thermoleophilia bacterium]